MVLYRDVMEEMLLLGQRSASLIFINVAMVVVLQSKSIFVRLLTQLDGTLLGWFCIVLGFLLSSFLGFR